MSAKCDSVDEIVEFYLDFMSSTTVMWFSFLICYVFYNPEIILLAQTINYSQTRFLA